MEQTFMPTIGAFVWIAVLLTFGTILRYKFKLFQTSLIPASLIAAVIGFCLMSFDLIGMPTSDGWR